MKLAWLDCSSGASGDMLLGALADLGIDMTAATIETLGLAATVECTPTTRGGLSATQVRVQPADGQPGRTWADIRSHLAEAPLPNAVRTRATAVFGRLAEAEAAVHAADPETVHFHEVGAVDALVDVVGVCWGLTELGLDRLVISPLALGSGATRGAHGTLPIPAPVVLRLVEAAGLTVYGGTAAVELCTPTGAALLAEWATGTGTLPLMRVARTGVGAGGRDLGELPNVVRLVVGDALERPAHVSETLLVEANVDDLDPRIWPGVLARLLAAGAADAWLVPIVMKKGRPAHTVCALVDPGQAAAVRRVLFTETTTIGARERAVTKTALARHTLTVDVGGFPVRAKVSSLDGRAVTVTPEWDDVEAAATGSGRPVKEVLADAARAAQDAAESFSRA